MKKVEDIEKKVFIYDIETLRNFFSIYFIDRDSNEEKYFIIHESKNEILELVIFLKKNCKGLIGFNNFNFDYPVLHYLLTVIITSYKDKINDANYVTELLYTRAQSIINSAKNTMVVWENNQLIPQLDLFRIHHFDNGAKRTSLKNLEFVMRMSNVEDMPIHHESYINKDQIKTIIDYNKHDVIATKLFYEESLSMVELRKKITLEFGINVMNYNDSRIGETIFLNYIAKEYGKSPRDIIDIQTPRDSINIGKIILPYIKFDIPEFQGFLNHLKYEKSIVKETKGAIKYKFIYDGAEYSYGLGGIHACTKSGVYKNSKTHKIIDIDVASFYPALAIVNGFYPEHLGERFCKIYKDRFDYRLSIKKDKEKKVEAGLWKLALNGVYGKSNDRYSFLYDPQFTMSITVNGQLLLNMLIEHLYKSVSSLKLLQANTDGITVMINREDESMLYSVCDIWQDLTGLILEYADYKKMIIRDVNNYIGVLDMPEKDIYPSFPESKLYDNWYTLHKSKGGAFQVVPEQNGTVAYNKNWSFRIIQKALYMYFIYDQPVRKTITESNDIFDFCGRYRNTAGWHTEYVNNKGQSQLLSKTTRYYMGSRGGRLYKVHEDGRKQHIEANGRTIVYNKHIEQPIEKYEIDYNYYFSAVNKIINNVIDSNMSLF